MWIIAKYKQNSLNDLKSATSKKFNNSIFYRPKILINYFKNQKLISKEVNLFNDYIFIHSIDFSQKNKLFNLNFTKGIKLVLGNSLLNQEELNSFITKCKNFEDASGYLKQDFFNFVKKNNFKFSNGPFTNIIFSIIEETRNKIKILIGKNNYLIDKNKYLYFPT